MKTWSQVRGIKLEDGSRVAGYSFCAATLNDGWYIL